VDGLIVMLGDGQLTRVDRNGTTLSFTGGEMTRSDYPDALCRMASVYMGAQDGRLMQVSRPMAPLSATSPRALLHELFKGPAACETRAVRIMPDGVSIDDVLGIRISGGEAVVNLSSNFYRCCQSLTPSGEQNLIYAMVNTLTGLDSVSSVRFQIEGETVDHLVSSMYLRGPLLRNPGIIRSAE
jgi:spore germination protein GerM